MKLLVFGKSGQVATEVGRLAPGARFLSRNEADLTLPGDCAEIVRDTDADIIINAAAYTAVDKAESEPETALVVNGTAVGAMAKVAARRKIPFLHISTDYVFNGTGNRPWGPDDSTYPLGVYGHSKLAGEKAITKAAGPFAILRTSWVVSAHGNNFVKTMLRLGRQREKLTVVGDQFGGPTPAKDIAQVLLKMAEVFYQARATSGIYHFSGAPDVSWADFAREIFRQADLSVQVTDIPTTDYPTPAIRPANSRLDCNTTKQVFGVPRPDWGAGLTQILEELGDSHGTA